MTRLVFTAALFMGLALATATPTGAEVSEGNGVITSIDGGLFPSRLPRSTPMPVGVRISGHLKSTDSSTLPPQVRSITIAINKDGTFSDRGLDVCPRRAIQGAWKVYALKVCGSALVGRGYMVVVMQFPEGPPFPIKAHLLIFNAPRHNGNRQLLAEGYTLNPLGTFVFPFQIGHKQGVFGTTITGRLPHAVSPWAHITQFGMTLKRSYNFRGKRRSYLSAACQAPAGFTRVLFPFAKVTYGLMDGTELTTTVLRSCSVTQ
jgi:hypothetical protein